MTFNIRDTISNKIEEDEVKLWKPQQLSFPIHEELLNELSIVNNNRNECDSQGLLELRQKIGIYYQKYTVMEISPEQIIIGPGTSTLLYLIQLLFNSIIILPNPFHLDILQQANINKNHLLVLETSLNNNYKITNNDLEELLVKNKTLQTKILILNNPNDNTGQIYTDRELIEISKVARKYNLIVLSIEIYAELTFTTYTSISKYYPEKTIICNDMSQSHFINGWKLGYLIFPLEMNQCIKSMKYLTKYVYGSVSHPIQLACIKGFGNPVIEQYIIMCRKVLLELTKVIYKKFITNNIGIIECQAGYNLILDFTKKSKTKIVLKNWNKLKPKIPFTKWVFKEIWEETGVYLVPGIELGRKEDELIGRLSLLDFDGSLVIEKAETEIINDTFILSYCEKQINLINKLIEWWL